MLETKTDLISMTESAMSSSNLSNYFAIILFKVKYETIDGQNVYILGNTKELGNWQPEKGLKLTTNETSYPIWFTTEEVKCQIGTEINYKYILMNSKTNKMIEWESNMSNRLYKVENKGIYEINYDKFCELTGFPNKEMFNFYLNNVFLPIKKGELRFSFQEEKLKKTINDVEMFFTTRKNKVTYDLPKLSYKDGIYYTNNYKENLDPLYKDDYDKLLEVTENYLNSLVKLNR